MRKRVLCGVVLAVAAVGLAVPARAQEKETVGKLLEKEFDKEPAKFRYLLYLPPDYGKEKKDWPLVLFLHGLGDKLPRMKRGGLPATVARKKEARFILVAPENPARGWRPSAVNALLEDVMAKYAVDKDRVYVTGLSMGGFGTWSLAGAYPDRFAAIIPICGGGSPKSVSKLKNLPIWVFHGGKDNIVPARRSEVMVKALKDAGSKSVKYTVYPEAGHDSWTATYRNPEVWEWLLKQKRSARKE
jgi:predicted peptidase